MNEMVRPFSGKFVKPAIFTKSPLVLVIFQIRWENLTSLSDDLSGEANAISAEISEKFPYSGITNEVSFRIDQSGVGTEPGSKIYNWFSLNKAKTVTLAPTFLTIQTSEYFGLENFMEDVAYVLRATLNHVRVPAISRAGFRYVNRALGNQSSANFVEPPLAAAQKLRLSDRVEIRHSISDLNLGVGQNSIQTRVGLLPPGISIDPAILPTEETSWIFDLDAFTDIKFYANVDDILDKGRELADLAYDFFITYTTDDFKMAHGMKHDSK